MDQPEFKISDLVVLKHNTELVLTICGDPLLLTNRNQEQVVKYVCKWEEEGEAKFGIFQSDQLQPYIKK